MFKIELTDTVNFILRNFYDRRHFADLKHVSVVRSSHVQVPISTTGWRVFTSREKQGCIDVPE